ncbi:MAG: hypothetical protein AAGG09_22050, partial [Pseudomonadota bacterium]
RRLATNREHLNTITDLITKRGVIVGEIGGKAKKLSDAVGKLRTADTALTGLVKEVGVAKGLLTTLDGTELDDREAIRKLRAAAEGNLRAYLSSWSQGYDLVQSQMNKVVPGTIPNIPPEADLRPKFQENFNALPGIPKDMSAGVKQAETEFDALISKMKQQHQDARVALDKYVGEAMELELKLLRLYSALSGTMSDYQDLAKPLAAWGVDGLKDLEDRAKALNGRIEDLGNGKVDTDKIKDIYTALNSETGALVRDARHLMSQTESAFNSEQATLKEEYTKLKNRLDALDKKTLPDEQRGPIAAFLAATETSIMKLGGSNTAALKAARQMLKEAERQVAQAENITSINNEIKSNIEVAQMMLKPLLDAKAPVNESATEHDKTVKAFEGEWVKQAPDDALKRSGELKKTAEALKVQNAMLVQNRAAASVELEKLEKKYEAFNALFKDLLKDRNAPKVRDYRGPIRGEIDGVKTWNTTKMDPSFQSTILARIGTLDKNLDERMNEMRAALGSSDKELADRVAAAKDLLDKAKTDGSSEEEVAKMQALYDQALNTQTVYNGLSQDLLAEERQEQKYIDDREKFLEDAAKWIKDTKKAQSSAKTGEPFELYGDEVDRQFVRLEATMKAAKNDKKGPTGTRGLAELKEVMAAVQRIADRGNMTPPDKLGDIAGNWSDAVLDFLDKSGTLVSEVADFEKAMGVDDKASRAIEKVLFEVYGRVAPTQFGEAGKILGATNPPKSAQERKAGREMALTEVRRIKKAILDDAVVKSCLANPFGIGGLTTKTIARLEQIELDVLRGA